MTDIDIDRVAEAIYEADESPCHIELYPWGSLDADTTQAHYRKLAQAAIDALDSARSASLPTDADVLGSLVIPWGNDS